MALGMWKDANKFNKISLSLSIAMLGALLLYIINSISNSYDYNLTFYFVMIAPIVILIITFSTIVYICVYVRKVNDKASTAIGFLNQRLRN